MSGLAAIILAGGRSSRMGGGDKPLFELAGEPILARTVRRLQLQTNAIAINANGDPSRFDAFGLPVIPDATDSYDGPLAGILAGLNWAEAQGYDWLLSVAGDTPFFPDDLAARLKSVATAHCIAVAASGGDLHPTFALWPIRLHDDLATQLAGGMRRVTEFMARHPSIAVAFPRIMAETEEIDPFFNVNTPDDLAEARRIAQKLGV